MLDLLAYYAIVLYILHKLICHALRFVKVRARASAAAERERSRSHGFVVRAAALACRQLPASTLKSSFVVITGCDTGFGYQISLRLQVRAGQTTTTKRETRKQQRHQRGARRARVASDAAANGALWRRRKACA